MRRSEVRYTNGMDYTSPVEVDGNLGGEKVGNIKPSRTNEISQTLNVRCTYMKTPKLPSFVGILTNHFEPNWKPQTTHHL